MTCLNVNMKRRRDDNDTVKNQRDDPRKIFTPSRVFECKTCDRHFLSFQALGGHRASHKKPRLIPGDDDIPDDQRLSSESKAHECSICGQEFPTGQALGGHMRRHRNTASAEAQSKLLVPNAIRVSLVKKEATRRVLWLDLNLSPWENYRQMQFLKGSPQKYNLPKFIHFL